LKTTFKKERDGAMVKRSYMELNKIILVTWVNKVFDQSLTKHNIKFGFRVCKIWPLNPKVMEVKTNPSFTQHQHKIIARKVRRITI
jgi:hypothetical protein